MTVPKCLMDMMENKNNLRTTEAQYCAKNLRTTKLGQKFTGSYK